MCMEGIEHNPVVYELMSEMAFRNERVDILVRQKSVLGFMVTFQCLLYGKFFHHFVEDDFPVKKKMIFQPSKVIIFIFSF